MSAATRSIWHDVECGGYAADLRSGRSSRRPRRSGAGARLRDRPGRRRTSPSMAHDGDRPRCATPSWSTAVRDGRHAGACGRRRSAPTCASFDLDREFALILAPMQMSSCSRPSATASAASQRRCRPPCARAAVCAAAIVEGRHPASPDGPARRSPTCASVDGWVYSSLPLGSRVGRRRRSSSTGAAPDRVPRRRAERGAERASDRLDALGRRRSEAEAARRACGRRAASRSPATDVHVGSTVVLLERRP